MSVRLLPRGRGYAAGDHNRSTPKPVRGRVRSVRTGGVVARQLTTKAQVNGYRFLIKRLEHALVRRDVRMLHDPMRSQLQALVVGTVLGLLVLGGCGVYGLVRPQGSVGDATIIVSKNSGGAATFGKIHAARRLGLPVIMVKRPCPSGAQTVISIAAIEDWIDSHVAAFTERGE